MTCIAGIVDHGTVWLGGDSAGIAEWSLTVRADPKVFRNGPLILGFTSSFRVGQLLQYKLQVPPRDRQLDISAYLVTSFIDAVRDCLKAGGVASKENEVENGGTFLIGYAGRLFEIYSDYQVGESLDGIAAVGCGAQVALGALYATPKLAPKKRLRVALQTAERCNAGVRAPFVILSSKE
jgi:hypothetical protein